MTIFISRSRRVMLGCIAGAGLVIAASPASALLYILDFSTPSQQGQIYFTAPAYSTPGALPGLITGIWSPGSYETTTGSGFNESGVKQQIKSIIPVGHFSNAFHQLNDNDLLAFAPNVSLHPPTSNQDTKWFSYGGFAVEAYNGHDVADATFLDIFVKPPVRAGGLPTFDVESVDRYGHVIT